MIIGFSSSWLRRRIIAATGRLGQRCRHWHPRHVLFCANRVASVSTIPHFVTAGQFCDRQRQML
jgi:hypothetical protein